MPMNWMFQNLENWDEIYEEGELVGYREDTGNGYFKHYDASGNYLGTSTDGEYDY